MHTLCGVAAASDKVARARARAHWEAPEEDRADSTHLDDKNQRESVKFCVVTDEFGICGRPGCGDGESGVPLLACTHMGGARRTFSFPAWLPLAAQSRGPIQALLVCIGI